MSLSKNHKGKNKPYEATEKDIMDHLVKAWELYLTLDITHPSHNQEFSEGVHKCQNVLIHKIVQRDYPETFPSYNGKEI